MTAPGSERVADALSEDKIGGSLGHGGDTPWSRVARKAARLWGRLVARFLKLGVAGLVTAVVGLRVIGAPAPPANPPSSPKVTEAPSPAVEPPNTPVPGPTSVEATGPPATPTRPSTAAAAPTATSEPLPRVRVANTDGQGTNIRAEPSGSAARVRNAADGSELKVIGADRVAEGRAWRNVRDPSDGASGWVAAELLAALTDAPAGAAIAPTSSPAEAIPPTAVPAAKASEPTAAIGSGAQPATSEPVAPAAAPAKPTAPAIASKAAGAGVRPQGGACPASHPIKGNQGSRSNVDWIYHTPQSRSYAATNPEECFATEAEARAAGYRAPLR
jgi:SH3-like domain-containing protein